MYIFGIWFFLVLALVERSTYGTVFAIVAVACNIALISMWIRDDRAFWKSGEK